MSENELGTITHAEYVGTSIDDQTLLLLRRANPADAKFVIVDSTHFRSLIKLAADGRIADVAYGEIRKILNELFVLCPPAGDAYLEIVRKNVAEMEKEA